MKKLLKIFSLVLSLIVWTYLYVILFGQILLCFWNFNILSAQSWNIVYQYWESGGIIRTWQDYLLLLCLVLYLPLWYIGWKHFRRISWLQVLLWPLNRYNRYLVDKYGEGAQHITIKNMGTGGIKIEEEIEQKAKPQTKIETGEEVNKIRAAVTEKINSVKHE